MSSSLVSRQRKAFLKQAAPPGYVPGLGRGYARTGEIETSVLFNTHLFTSTGLRASLLVLISVLLARRATSRESSECVCVCG